MSSKKILVIDDEPSVAKCVKDFLTPFGYEVDLVLTGTEGFRGTVFGFYDLVIVDLCMPELKGDEVIRMLRVVNADVKIVVHTGFLDDFEDNLNDLNVDAILEKPCPPSHMHEILQGLLGE